jgi:hypothetical protein
MDTWSAYRSFLIAYRASEFTTFALATTHAPRFYTLRAQFFHEQSVSDFYRYAFY